MAADSAVVVRDRLHAALLAYSGLAGTGYWVQWFTDESARTSDDPAYLEHNRSFVLADAYLAGAALLAARQLWKAHPFAVPLGVATGSAMTFLGLLDLLYDLQHGTFSDRSSAARLEASSVGSGLVLGPATMPGYERPERDSPPTQRTNCGRIHESRAFWGWCSLFRFRRRF